MEVLSIEKGRVDKNLSLKSLTNNEMDSIKGGSICVCDVRFCLDCNCVQAGNLCVCDVKRNCWCPKPLLQ